MMRSRAKAVGLGLALFAGQAGANDPLPTPASEPWTAAGPSGNDPIWMSPRRPAPTAAVPVPLVIPPAPQVQPSGPRADTRPSPLAPLPVIPALPDPAAPPPAVTAPPPPVSVAPSGLAIPPVPDGWQPARRPDALVNLDLQEPAPAPRPAEQPRALPLPKPSPVEPPMAAAPRSELPPLRVLTPVQHELPCAPPELMTPHGVGVPGVHGTFGSPPISLSRDYPACRDILDNMGLGQSRLFSPPTGPPATDRLFFSAEYLLWWVNRQQIPVLATTSVNGGDGYLSDPGTRTLLGPGAFGDSLRHGLRLRGGAWLNETGTWGVDGSFFFLGRRSNSVSFDPVSTPTITRPIFATNIGAEFGEIVSQPTFSRGSFTVEADSQLWGADANLRHAICRRCDFRHEVFAGYRFLSLKESLLMSESITALETAPNPVGTQVFVQDSFRTKNQFHGGQIGGLVERKWGRVSLEVRGSVALGATRQEVDINGFQNRQQPGGVPPEQFVGGLLAAGPNLGNFSRNKFSVVPEATINLGYWVTPNAKAFVGYNVLYWSNVLRPGDQIDRVVNVSFVPNPPVGTPFSDVNRPLPTFKQTDLWANGLQFGVELRW